MNCADRHRQVCIDIADPIANSRDDTILVACDFGDERRNPTGISGSPALRLRNRDIRAALMAGMHEQCEIPGYEHMTNSNLASQ